MNKGKIAVLLATYNSAKYLIPQIDSIINQTNKEWTLYIRDDGSVDNTLDIINDYCNKYPNRIILLSDDRAHLTAGKSFMRLLEYIEADYYMFCDHDDVWKQNKIEKTYLAMQRARNENNDDTPLLIFTDLEVVDENLKTVCRSMWDYSFIDPENSGNIYKLLSSPTVTGCTMMINKCVKQYVFPYPEQSIIHDWWISLNVSYYGRIYYIKDQTILYRQHGGNLIGIERPSIVLRMKKLSNVIYGNLAVLKMIKSLSFKINYFKFLFYKLCALYQRYIISENKH